MSAERSPLVVHGAGGHGRAVAEAASLAGHEVLGFLDDGNADVSGFRHWRSTDDLPEGVMVHVAIGDARARRTAWMRHVADRRGFASVVHPTAFVSDSSPLGRASFVGPGAVVGPGCRLDDSVIFNSGSILEHDGAVGPFSHIGPGAVIGGGVRIDDRTLIGLGARVLPGLHIGGGVTVGAGSVILRNVADGETVCGVVK